MSSTKKVIISFFITVLIFSFFAFVSYTRLFSVIETRFYQPSVIKGMENRLTEVSACLDEYTMQQATSFSYFTELSCVKSLSALVQTDEDIKNREDYASSLILANSGLQGIRIIDSNGEYILFSTFKEDSLYNKNSELPYEAIKANNNPENKNKAKIIFDNTNERIIYSIPFYDSYDIYRGSTVFYVAGVDFNRFLISKNVLSVSERAKLVATVFSDSSKQSRGFVLGLPSISSDVLIGKITDLWIENSYDTQKILHSEDYNWFVISDNSGKTGIISLVFKDDILFFNDTVKYLLLTCLFITLFLITLLFFNLKQDDESIIRDKIKKFKFALINEYLSDSENANWQEVSKFLTVRKHQINNDIKRFLGKKGEKNEILVEHLLDKTWNEVEQVIVYHENLKETEEVEKRQDEENLNLVDEENSKLSFEILPKSDGYEDLEQLEELEELEELATIEEIEEVEEIEEIDSLEDVTELEKLEEANKKIESSYLFNKNNTSSITDLNFEIKQPDFGILDEENEIYEIFNDTQEDLESAEEVDELEELEELEEVTDTTEVSEVATLSELEPLQDVVENEKNEIIDDSRESSEPEILPEAELEELNSIEIFSLVSNFRLSFCSTSKLEELQSVENLSQSEKDESIVESATGLFFIPQNIDTKNVKIDSEFKNLVDSVLQNNI